MNKCSIIIATYNEAPHLRQCLSSLEKLKYPASAYEIILIDNNSTDNTKEIVKAFPKVHYYFEARQGVASARNAGIRRAKNDILVFLDADAYVDGKWLEEMVQPFQSIEVGAVGGAILPIKANNLISEYFSVSLFLRNTRYGKQCKATALPGGNLAMRHTFLKKGLETFSTYNCDDKAICAHIRKKGYKVVFQPTAIMYHRHPENFKRMFHMLIKSSKGRASYGKIYPKAPEIIVLNTHLPVLFPIILFILLNKGFYVLSLIISSPILFFYVFSCIRYYIYSKKILLCFLIKPIFDFFSVFVIYTAYTYYKYMHKPQ